MWYKITQVALSHDNKETYNGVFNLCYYEIFQSAHKLFKRMRRFEENAMNYKTPFKTFRKGKVGKWSF